LLAAALVVIATACGSESDSDEAAEPSSTVATSDAPDDDVVSIDDSEFCDIFRGMSERSQAQESADGLDRYEDEAAWEAGIANVERIVETAPDEIAGQAATYLELVGLRQELAASYDYEPVPSEVKMAFGQDHAAMQQEANEMIAFAMENCTGVE
jgi:hypothetical protein